MKIKTIGIVSLSSGMLGEDFAKRQRELGISRLEAYGIKVKFMTNALKGIKYLHEHPEARAADLIEAFRDPEVDLIMTAIGGDDTYRLLPYLFGHDELKNALTDKLFLGFSDTTVNHLMLHKLGLPTLYGQAFLTEICELGPEMLPYSRQCFEELIETGRITEVRPSPLWYEEHKSFGPEEFDRAVGWFGTRERRFGMTGDQVRQIESEKSGPGSDAAGKNPSAESGQPV